MSFDGPEWIDSLPPARILVRLGRMFESGGPNQFSRSSNGAPLPVRTPKPKRQRIRPAPDGQSSGSQTYYFVDSSNPSSREKRAHAMRHCIERRRKSQQDSRDRANGHSDPTASGSGNDEPDMVERNKSGGPSENTAVELQHKIMQSRRLYSGHRFPPLNMSFDASRTDPFHSLPAIAGSRDMELVDYWINRLSYWSGQNPHIKNMLFRTAMDHPLVFQATILLYCARWRTQIYGLENSSELQRHLCQVEKGIEEVRKGTMTIDKDGFSLILAGLALQEERFGSAKAAEEHVSQAITMLQSGTEPKTVAEIYLHYVRYMIIPPSPVISTDGRQWLVTFLRGAEELMEEHSTDTCLAVAPDLRMAFRMGSPLFPLLSAGPHPTQVPLELRMYVVRNAPTRCLSRSVALIYITAALWDFRNSLSKTMRFLEYLFTIVREHRLDRDPACETLVWALLEGTCDMDLRDSQRAWSTAELLNVSKGLPAILQFQFNEILMGFLQLTRPIPGVSAFEQDIQQI